MKICMHRAVTSEPPNNDDCVRQLAYGGCSKCRFNLEELPEPERGHENDKDELPC